MAETSVIKTGNQRLNIGLVMMGGGARAAYQVGVLQGIAEMAKKGSASPFNVITGISAGAINAAALASAAHNYHKAVHRLATVWGNFHCNQIFYSDWAGIGKTGARWLLGMMLANMGKERALCLLDRTPLHELLSNYLRTEGIKRNIDKGILHAVSVTASGYLSGQSVTFYEGQPEIASWKRARRVGCRENIGVDHLMASSAIPFIFDPVKVNREFFGDGSIRLIAPLSAALHLGADRVLVMGNRMEDENPRERVQQEKPPSFAQVAAHVLNSIFLDSLEADLERLNRINSTLDKIPEHTLLEGDIQLRKVETLMIAPSEDIGKMAEPYKNEMPLPLRLLLRGIGAMKKEGSTLMSYLLFEKGYCRDLMELGFEDTIAMKSEIRDFLNL